MVPQYDEEILQAVLEDSLSEITDAEKPQHLRAALLVLTDLARQRWRVRVTAGEVVEVQRPSWERTDSRSLKEGVREQELIKRDEQLRGSATRKFILGMERSVPYRGKQVSIFSLFRDGRELGKSLRRVRRLPPQERAKELRSLLDPYIQFVQDGEVCDHTGFRLQDIWRYFRHTWANQYTNTPGRWMAFLVRDRALQLHPVIGIGAIGSPIVQIRERDTWIGWDAETFFESVSESSATELGVWLGKIVDRAIDETLIDDFLEKPLLDRRDLLEPSTEAISRLRLHGERQRNLHHRFVQQQEHKTLPKGGGSPWKTRAETHLYRSKRAIFLADMLRARRTLRKFLGDRPTPQSVRGLMEDSEGRRTVRTVLRKAKADRVGIAMADITVCGAIAPYNEILGGKLVSMLAASPEVILKYRDRYRQQESEIASSMAGRPIIRPSHLVFLGTTSLYGAGASQYNRLKMPTKLLGGSPDEHLEFRRLGKSEAYGTSHFSSATVESLVRLVEQTSNGQRVNSIFGEGVSPKLRKLRDGLGVLGLPEDALLQHGRERIVYGVPLARNLRRFLIGLDEEPDYLVELDEPQKTCRAIVDWWRERWLTMRIKNDKILERLDEHILVHPIRHGARVVLPSMSAAERPLFDDYEI